VKTIQTRALAVAIASMLSAAAHAQSSGNASWNAYRSIVNPSVVVDDSFNRSSEVDTRIDNSRSAEDSFNRSTDVDTRIATDNSRSTDDSFNRTYDNDTTIDASRRASDSYNTALDYQTVAPNVRTVKSIATQDTQSASNSGYMGGATQVGTQGDFSLNMGGGQPAAAQGGKYWSPASMSQGYDLAQRNSVVVDGDNNGLIRAQNALNLGGSQIVDSDLGNKQSFYAGDQTQVQGNTQDKRSATQTYASDVVSTTVGN
jgi:hypothetical protein